MGIKNISIFCLLIFGACTSQEKIVFRPDPESKEKPARTVEFTEILETQDGAAAENLPDWLSRFISGGIQEIERSVAFGDKFVFIGRNRGNNFTALRQWAEGFTVYHDFPRLAAIRIENRMISAATLYPDDEYGEYFEALIKQASDAEYPGAVKEETYWIKTLLIRDIDEETEEQPEPLEQYEFFVLISIGKPILQSRIRSLMADIQTTDVPTRAQRAAVNRVQHIFFEGF